MTNKNQLEKVPTPASCEGIPQKRRVEIAGEANAYISSKSAPFLLTFPAGVVYHANYSIVLPQLYGQAEATEETKYGYSGRFVILPELLNDAGAEQLYKTFCHLALIDLYEYKGEAKKADNWFLKESEGEREDAPVGAWFCELKKTWAKKADARPIVAVGRDGKPIDPARIVSGSLIRPQLWVGTPTNPTYGKRLWGSICQIQLLKENEGEVAAGETRSINDDIAPGDNDAAAEAYATKFGQPQIAGPSEGAGAGTGTSTGDGTGTSTGDGTGNEGENFDDDIPF